MRLIPAGATIAELEKKATDCEEQARKEAEPGATKLREEALLYRAKRTIQRSPGESVLRIGSHFSLGFIRGIQKAV